MQGGATVPFGIRASRPQPLMAQPPLQRDEDVHPTRGLALWAALVAIVVFGIILAFRYGSAIASLLGTRG